MRIRPISFQVTDDQYVQVDRQDADDPGCLDMSIFYEEKCDCEKEYSPQMGHRTHEQLVHETESQPGQGHHQGKGQE